MNKLTLSRLVLVCSLLFISFHVFGQDADICTKIEDPIFKDYCLQQFDSNKDGMISLEEASQVTGIYVAGKNIKSLTGIEYFVNVTSLYCHNNQLTSLDVSKNTALDELNCGSNQLTSLDVSKNMALKRLYCHNNQLTSLDVSKNTALDELNCGSNQLTSLDVSKNMALENFNCSSNQLANLDISKNTRLTVLECAQNRLTSIDISMNKWLIQMDCRSNKLTNLDVSNNAGLRLLRCDDDIQLVGAPIKIDDPIFKSYCLKNFDTDNDGSISEKEAAKVEDIYVNEMNIRSLKGIEYFTNLKRLRCMSNQLTSLDVGKNTALEVLHCGWNQLTNLDVSKNTALRVFSCNSNNLKNLDVSKNTKLTSLDCGNTQLTSLDVSKNTALTSLNCMSNELTRLDINKNTQLEELDCRWNQFTTLDVSNNTQLNELKFDGSVIGNAQLKNSLPYWVFDYKWSYTNTVKGTQNVPASRDFKISFEHGNRFTITITNRSPLQVDCWQKTWEGTYTYSNGKIVLSYNSERTILIIDYENQCLRSENGKSFAKSYS